MSCVLDVVFGGSLFYDVIGGFFVNVNRIIEFFCFIIPVNVIYVALMFYEVFVDIRFISN